ncbi:uncharacterized protein N7479_003707 [Penicillium vulpinum]|uniref:uncharacterized protein n=1 Tax=Penicillium vulpinum TaxID=29845 RepID=UPI0025472E05|nr:uncharacterized protein N7479_003707 [Penicillium vulpinum]KAJ5963831.1 hypothetical protein N7479_003707 [Penicillium vulpinum]
MTWSLDETVSHDSSIVNERCWETGYLDDLNESPFSHSQYSFLATNQNMPHPTQDQARSASNTKYTSQYSVAEGIAADIQLMGHSTPTP